MFCVRPARHKRHTSMMSLSLSDLTNDIDMRQNLSHVYSYLRDLDEFRLPWIDSCTRKLVKNGSKTYRIPNC